MVLILLIDIIEYLKKDQKIVYRMDDKYLQNYNDTSQISGFYLLEKYYIMYLNKR